MVISPGCSPIVEPGIPTLAESRAQDRLTGDEGRSPSRAALLGVVVGEHHAFAGDAVDVWRAIAHQAERIGADVRLADVVAEDDKDVRLLAGWRGRLLLSLRHLGGITCCNRRCGGKRRAAKEHVAAINCC